jgi:two-component system, OmpR family, response regulator RegX3
LLGAQTLEAEDILDRRAGANGMHPVRSLKPRVVLVESEAVLAGQLAEALARADFIPVLAFDVSQAHDAVAEQHAALVLLGPSHSAATEEFARHTELPVLSMGHHRSLADMFDAEIAPGASMSEIVSRCRSLIQISRAVPLPAKMKWGPLELDPGRRTALWRGRPLSLTSIQFRIMEVLVLAVGCVVTPEELSRRIWGPHGYDDRERILAHIRRIRKSIEPNPSRPVFLLTVRGEGYRLADQEIEEPIIDLSVLDGSSLASVR